jgi:O-antigen/teichoic acid export membrane protein
MTGMQAAPTGSTTDPNPPASTNIASEPEFRGFATAGGRIAIGRQLASGIFIVALFALPNLASGATTSTFVWAYYGMLTITSLFGLGLERVSVIVMRAHREGDRGAPLAPLVLLRVVTMPLSALALVAMFAFVRVDVSVWTWAATVLWVFVVGLESQVFGARRYLGDSSTEPTAMFGARILQTAALLALAGSGAPVGAIVLAMALGELVATVWAWRGLEAGFSPSHAVRGFRALPWGELGFSGAIEFVALGYLRADVLIVGRFLGPIRGAAYGLVYRVLDGLNGLQGGLSVWLFAHGVRRRAAGDDQPDMILERSLRLLPAVAALLALVPLLLAGLLGDLVTSLRGVIDTLRLLMVVFPLYVVSAATLYVEAGRGRHRRTLVAGCIALAVNVAVCGWLIPAYGVIGASWALIVSEAVQLVVVTVSVDASDRSWVARAALRAAVCAGGLLIVAVFANAGLTPVAGGVAVIVALGLLVDTRTGWRAGSIPTGAVA